MSLTISFILKNYFYSLDNVYYTFSTQNNKICDAIKA